MATSTIVNLTVIAFLITAAAADTPATAYTNHTVGDSAGWFFNATTNTSSADYSKWAANQTFNLGDYLLFKTNTNQTVVHTYNETTYRSCSTDDSSDEDTFHYDAGSDEFGASLTFAVPLTKVGPNYFFSDGGDDEVQCQQGMAFEIDVKRGLGLPPSLNQPPPPPYIEPPPADSAQSPPAGVQQPSNGGRRSGANVRGVVCGVLFFFLGILVSPIV